MSALDRLRQRFPKLDPDVIGTHYDECHTTHPPCAYLLGHDDGHAEGERAATSRIADELTAEAERCGSGWWTGLAINLSKYGTLSPSIEQVREAVQGKDGAA